MPLNRDALRQDPAFKFDRNKMKRVNSSTKRHKLNFFPIVNFLFREKIKNQNFGEY